MLKQKPSAKLHRRYISIKGKKENIEKAVLDYVGILGWAKAAPVFVKSKGSGFVLVVNRKELENVRAALALSADKIEVLKVSGTLKGLGKK